MYKKFKELFRECYWDTSLDICMVPAFDAMELADTLLFLILRRGSSVPKKLRTTLSQRKFSKR